MNQLRAWILQRLDREEAVVLAAVTQASGSTARGTDALLAMDARGAMVGTVGGGYAEHMAIEAARELFEQKTRPAVHQGLRATSTSTFRQNPTTRIWSAEAAFRSTSKK